MKSLRNIINEKLIIEKLIIGKNTKMTGLFDQIIDTLFNNPENKDKTNEDWNIRGYIGEFVRASYHFSISQQINIKDKALVDFSPVIGTNWMVNRPHKKILLKKRLDTYSEYYDDIKCLLYEIKNNNNDGEYAETKIVDDDIMLLYVSSDYQILIHYDKSYEDTKEPKIYNLMIKKFK